MKYSCGENNLIMFEKILKKEDIIMIVWLYENIFRNYVFESKVVLDRDYKEWIFVIRYWFFVFEYRIEEVFCYVWKWYDVFYFFMFKFYLFIFISFFGFGKENINGSSEFLFEVNVLKKDMEKVSKYVLKFKYLREWLCKLGEGIKILEFGIRFLGYSFIDDRNLKEDIY